MTVEIIGHDKWDYKARENRESGINPVEEEKYVLEEERRL